MQCSGALLWPTYPRSIACLHSCIDTHKYNRARPSLRQVQGHTPTTGAETTASWSSLHITERHTPRRRSHGRLVSTASAENRGIFQLGQLTQPSALQSIWQEDVQQSCHAVWQDLRKLALQQLSIRESVNSSVTGPDAQQRDPLQPEQFVVALDSLLGTLQQVMPDTSAATV